MAQNPPPGPPGAGIQGPRRSGGAPGTGFSRGMPDDEARMWALLAHGSAIPLSFVGPLLVKYAKGES